MNQCTQSITSYFLNFNRSDSAQIYHRILKTRFYLHSKRIRIRNTSSVSTKYLAARGNGRSALESIHSVVSKLCPKSCNRLLKCHWWWDHIELLMKAFRAHRDGADRVFSEDVIPEVKTLAEKLGIDLTMPRRCARQVHRPNVGGSIEEYYRRTIYVPYMDSL